MPAYASVSRAPAPESRAEAAVPPPGDGIDLFDLDSGTRILKLLLEFRRLVLVDALLDRLRRALDQVFGLLETETRDRADFLDHVDLLVANGRKDDVELGLLG